MVENVLRSKLESLVLLSHWMVTVENYLEYMSDYGDIAIPADLLIIILRQRATVRMFCSDSVMVDILATLSTPPNKHFLNILTSFVFICRLTSFITFLCGRLNCSLLMRGQDSQLMI